VRIPGPGVILYHIYGISLPIFRVSFIKLVFKLLRYADKCRLRNANGKEPWKMGQDPRKNPDPVQSN